MDEKMQGYLLVSWFLFMSRKAFHEERNCDYLKEPPDVALLVGDFKRNTCRYLS
jgi:hypothetical protein